MNDNNQTVAAIQMSSGSNLKANLHQAEKLLLQAIDTGAELIVLPENFAFMGDRETEKLKVAEQDGEGEIQDFLSQQAKKHGIWIVGGTIPIKSNETDKIRSACMLFSDKGQRVARYDKIHLFDVAIPESGDQYIESEITEAGDDLVCLQTPFGRLALSVCYDLRFPEFFRSQLDQGIDIIAVPSAFTAQTGKAHWEVLLRARAIENLSFVIAAAQGGFHMNGRETYGHSMIVDPWGNILNTLAKGSGVITAQINREQMENIRKAFPSLEHRRIRCQ
ncbi:MAG: carbon-nitrogen hydrolase family protein [Gammaproteobacteria bacterium]|nr:MAG: carbon-nitrogen hydrolase family protein [Gammaproteobacteria bacterium]